MAQVRFVDKRVMQHELFSKLSDMFGREVPMYDRALLINATCNRSACDLLAQMYEGLSVSDEEIEKTSGERHGAIRIGRPDEYRWICRLFACFAMEPHNFYDMTSIGAKSQPVIATAFRSTHRPDHRVFASLLQTNYFDDAMRIRIEDLLSKRQVFTATAKELIEKCELEGGLEQSDADQLIREASEHIFKWTGKARDPELYHELCESGFKIAADIACFTTHHLNHLTPNTLCMDLYTAAMRKCLGEISDDDFLKLAQAALESMMMWMDQDALVLHFKHLSSAQLRMYDRQRVSKDAVTQLVGELLQQLSRDDHDLSRLQHNGFKDYTEGPSAEKLVLLRQDAYKALTENVDFDNGQGEVIKIDHTARFGEIEQRYYATTPKGRALYDACISEVNALLAASPELPKQDPDQFAVLRAEKFGSLPGTLGGLIGHGLVYGVYRATEKGCSESGRIGWKAVEQLVQEGHVTVEGLRYEDFLPISAAGIFASNLNQYGTDSTAQERPTYSKQYLEDILGRSVIDTDTVYSGIEAKSLLDTYEQLGLVTAMPVEEREMLQQRVSAYESVVSSDALHELVG